MNRQNVAVKVKPILVRKRTIVHHDIQVIARPATKQTTSLSNLVNKSKAPQGAPPQQVIIKQSAPAQNRACNRPIKVEKKTKVKYITRDIDEGSLAKIKQLKGVGRNKILAIIGNGPSINEADLGKLKNNPIIDTLSVNKPDPRLWPTTYWAFFDLSQLRRNENLWNEYNGKILNSTSIKRQKLTSLQVKNIGGQGFSRDMTKGIHIGRSSVYAAMQIAYWMEYQMVYIFGVDMQPEGINGKLHFYGDNPDVDPQKRAERFKAEASFYEYAANILTEEERKRFIFCSSVNKWAFVDKFSRIRHETAVQHILDTISTD